MATKTKKTSNIPAIAAGNLPAVQKRIAPATIVEPKNDDQFSDIERPDFLTDNMIEDMAPTGFNPLIDFEDEPGRWIVAKYVGTRSGIGPNQSNMYDFEAFNPETKKLFVASLWGSYILDRKMELLEAKGSLVPGKYCMVQYLGAVNTTRNQNPAKNFNIYVLNAEALKKYLDAIGIKS